jgi:hypothetical protein
VSYEIKLIQTCLKQYKGSFANGEQANNKLDLETLPKRDPELYNYSVRRLGKLILPYDVDFIVPVPNGACGLARDVADSIGVIYVPLVKRKDDSIACKDEGAELSLADGVVGAVVEDVFNKFTNTKKVLSVPGLASKIVVAVALFDRGDPSQREEPQDVAIESLAGRYIPANLPKNSEFRKLIS